MANQLWTALDEAEDAINDLRAWIESNTEASSDE